MSIEDEIRQQVKASEELMIRSMTDSELIKYTLIYFPIDSLTYELARRFEQERDRRGYKTD